MSACQSIAARNYDRVNAYALRLHGAAMHNKSLHLTYYQGNTPDLGKAVAQAECHAVLMQAYKLYEEGVVSKNSSSLASVYEVDILNKLTPYGLFKLTPIDNL